MSAPRYYLPDPSRILNELSMPAALGFAYVERILQASDKEIAVASALSTLESSISLLEYAEFEKLVYEDFYDVFASLVNQVVVPEHNGTVLTTNTLIEAFQSPEGDRAVLYRAQSLNALPYLIVSNSIVVFLRLLTSAQIRIKPDDYAPFLFHPESEEPMDTQGFCENFVEAVGKEAG